MADVESFLKDRKESGLFRILHPATSRVSGKIAIDGREYIDLSSNDYLGLSNHPKIIQAQKQALDEFGTSGVASRILSGDSNLHHVLEEKIASFKNKEAGLVLNSGYQANVSIIPALAGKGSAVFSDRLNHASIIDGIMLSQSALFRFRHNDTAHLEELLKKERARFKDALIITESVFSMDGDKASLKELVALKKQYDCKIFVDEAHATGIFGKNGSGVAEESGLSQDIDLIMGTFGKALAGFGAYIATSQRLKEYLINSCRGFIYSTALPPAVIAGNIAALDLIKEEPERRRGLLKLSGHFRNALRDLGFDTRGESQIVPLITKDVTKAVIFSEKLREKGYWVLPIRPPTVPKNAPRLRFSLSYAHSEETLTRLIKDIYETKI
ncbi:MAG: 8-amino-7-oxononanoate synthase [Candidatus Omnitrophica bacterium]|nr:8-amino-7-oxononanoate synthase [Candidatus Omnitrophota bacterium]